MIPDFSGVPDIYDGEIATDDFWTPEAADEGRGARISVLTYITLGREQSGFMADEVGSAILSQTAVFLEQLTAGALKPRERDDDDDEPPAPAPTPEPRLHVLTRAGE